MGSEKQEAGRDQVRAILLEPLEALGLARPTDLNAASFKKMPNALAKNLAYMGAGALDTLRITVEANLCGSNKNHWPSPAMIYKWARDLEPEPKGETDLVVSYLRSRAGPRALQGGYIVELRTDLARFRRPPSVAALEGIQARAQKNARRRTIISENVAVGRASADDLSWVAAYWEIHEGCAKIVNEGEDARAEKEQAA